MIGVRISESGGLLSIVHDPSFDSPRHFSTSCHLAALDDTAVDMTLETISIAQGRRRHLRISVSSNSNAVSVMTSHLVRP